MDNGGSVLTFVCAATCGEEFLKKSCRRTRWSHPGTLWCWPGSHVASASHLTSSWSHFKVFTFSLLKNCPPLKKFQQGSNRGGSASSCSMVQLKIAPADSLRSLSSSKSQQHHHHHQQSDLLRQVITLNCLSTSPILFLLFRRQANNRPEVTKRWLTNFFLEFLWLVRAAENMVTWPRAESNCCKSECTARATALAAPTRARASNTNVSPTETQVWPVQLGFWREKLSEDAWRDTSSAVCNVC